MTEYVGIAYVIALSIALIVAVLRMTSLSLLTKSQRDLIEALERDATASNARCERSEESLERIALAMQKDTEQYRDRILHLEADLRSMTFQLDMARSEAAGLAVRGDLREAAAWLTANIDRRRRQMRESDDGASPWMGIDSAPEDGTRVLLFWPEIGGCRTGYMRKDGWVIDGPTVVHHRPTHWSPVPEIPDLSGK